MNKKVLVTGGAGFIGSALSLQLLSEGYDVTVYDNLTPQIHGNSKKSFTYNLIKDKVELIKGDVRDEVKLTDALNNKNIVVHLAAETGTGQSMYEIEKYVDVNVHGTSVLLNAISNLKQKNKIERIILSSSRAIYGEGKYYCSEHRYVYPNLRAKEDLMKGIYNCRCPECGEIVEPLPTDEKSAHNAVSLYGLTKLQQEQLLALSSPLLDISYIILRFQNVYGPGQSLSNPYTGILSIFSNVLRNNNVVNIFEDGLESRDFVYIADIVSAIILAIQKTEVSNEVFNVGTGIKTTVKEVTDLLAKYWGRYDKYSNITGDFRLGDIRHNVADLGKINSFLAYKPKVAFSDGINIFLDWVASQESMDGDYKLSLNELEKKGLLIKQNYNGK